MRKKSLKSVLTFVFALMFVLQTAFAAVVPSLAITDADVIESELAEENTSLVSDDEGTSFMLDENGDLVELEDDFDYEAVTADADENEDDELEAEAVLANIEDYNADDAGVVYYEDFEKYSEGEAEGVVDNFKRMPYASDESNYQTRTNAKIKKGFSTNNSNVLAINIPSDENGSASKNVDFVLGFAGIDDCTSVTENGIIEVSFRGTADTANAKDSGIVSLCGKNASSTTAFPGTESASYTFSKSTETNVSYSLSSSSKPLSLGVKWTNQTWHKYTAVMNVENGVVTGIDYFVDNALIKAKQTPSKDSAPAPGVMRIRPSRSNLGSTVYIDNVTVVSYDEKLQDAFNSLGIKDEYSDNFELPTTIKDTSIVYSVEESPYISVERGSFTVIPSATEDIYVTISARLSYNNGGSYSTSKVITKTVKILKNNAEGALENQYAREDLMALDLSGIDTKNINADFNLPIKGSLHNSDITWTADFDYIVVDASGRAKVTLPEYSGVTGRTVTLTAHAKNGISNTHTKEFKVRVLEAGPDSDEEKVKYDKTNLDFDIDLTDVRANIALPNGKYSNITWSSNKDAIVIQEEDGTFTGVVTTPKNGEVEVKLTATITAGKAVDTKVFELTVKSQNVVKAFPGAEGFGAYSKGGRGGYVYHVTNLSSDSNTKGSLGYGLEKISGARTIVFDVAGTIDMTDRAGAFKISGEKAANITIAGQTAPYPGIQLKGYGMTVSNTHDVVIRHIRIRIGDVLEDGVLDQMDPLSMSSSKNVIVDHCSFTWAIDMGFRSTCENVTMSNVMISKNIDKNSPHDKGGGHNYAGMFGSRKASFVKNYLSDSGQRTPRLVDGEYVDAYNNVLYNNNNGFDVTNYEWMGVNIIDSVHDNFAQDGPTLGNQGGKFIRVNRGRDYAGGVLLYGKNNYGTANNSDKVIEFTDEKDNYLKNYDIQTPAFGKSSIKYTLQFGNDNKTLITGKESGYTDDYDLSNVTLDEWLANPLSYDNNNKVSPGATLTLLPYPLPVPRANLVNDPDNDSGEVAAQKIFDYVTANVGATKPARDLQDQKYMLEAQGKTKGKASLSREAIQEYCDQMNIRTQYEKVFNYETNSYEMVKKNVYDIDEVMAVMTNPEDPEGYPERRSERVKDFYENGANGLYDNGRSTNELNPTIYKNNGDSITWTATSGDGPIVKGSGSGDVGAANSPIPIKWDPSWWEEYVGFPMNADTIYHTNADIPEEYRTDEQNANLGQIIVWDSQQDGIPDWYKDVRGWDKTRAINNVYLESGYSCLEEYLAFMADDEEFDAVTNNKGTVAENFKVNNIGYCTAQPYWNTDYRAKCTIYYDTEKHDNIEDYERSEKLVYTSKTDGYHTYHSIVLAELESDQTYYYRVKAVDEFGMERISDEQSFTTTELPGAINPEPPVISISRPYINQVYLKWTGNVQTDESYRVRYGTESGVYTGVSDLLDRKTYETTITGLKDGVKYYFVVEAINERGSTYSKEVTATPSNSLIYYDYTKMTDAETKAYLAQRFIYNLGGEVAFKNKKIAGGEQVLEYHDTDMSHGIDTWINFPVNQEETFTAEIELMVERYMPTYGTEAHATFQINFLMDNEVDESGSSLDSRDFTQIAGIQFDQGTITYNSETLTDYLTSRVQYSKHDTNTTVEKAYFNKLVKTQEFTMADLEAGKAEWVKLKVVGDCKNNVVTIYKDDEEVGSGLIFSEDVDGPYNVGRIQLKARNDGVLIAFLKSINIYSGTEASIGVSDNMNNFGNLIGTDGVANVGSGNGNKPSGGSGGGGGGGSTPAATENPTATTEPSAEPTTEPTNVPDDKPVSVPEFNDIANVSWAEEAIKALASEGIVNGVSANQFAPLDNVTRAQFVTMLMRAFEKDTEIAEAASFSDVKADEWYTESISKAASLGVVNGMDDGSFGVDELITRQDMMVMAYRLLANKGVVIPEIREEAEFADSSDIADYAQDAITGMYKAGVINGVGDNMLNPTGMANRAEAAKILYGLKNIASKISE